jgi:hypothetical protein
VLKLSTQGTLPEGTALAGLGVTIELPVGVSAATQSGGAVAATVVVPSGVSQNATVAPVYHAAAGTVPGTLNFVLTSMAVNGFGAGEFATVTLVLSPGTVPLASDFKIISFSPVDLHGGSTTALSATCTLQVF